MHRRKMRILYLGSIYFLMLYLGSIHSFKVFIFWKDSKAFFKKCKLGIKWWRAFFKAFFGSCRCVMRNKTCCSLLRLKAEQSRGQEVQSEGGIWQICLCSWYKITKLVLPSDFCHWTEAQIPLPLLQARVSMQSSTARKFWKIQTAPFLTF